MIGLFKQKGIEKMKFAIIMNDNSYVGREYLKVFKNKKIDLDVICIGTYPVENAIEDERCNKLWKPPYFEDVSENRKVYRFDSLNSEEIFDFFENKRYDVGIQGGTGILKKKLIDTFKYGILNFHPGDLPQYRGCSAPEWQLFENRPIVCTCHLVDEGIDTGNIYKKKVLNVDKKDYHIMRSQIYIEISKFVYEVVTSLKEDFVDECVRQNEDVAIYRNYIGEEKINYIIQKMHNE